jgi:hypothetical protein
MPFEAEFFHSPYFDIANPLSKDVVKSIETFLKTIDEKILKLMVEKKIPLKDNLLCRRLNYVALVDIDTVHIIYEYSDSSSPKHYFYNRPHANYSTESLQKDVENTLHFAETESFSFPKIYLSENIEQNTTTVAQYLFDKFMTSRQLAIEKQKRLVKTSPIFHGRDFMINESLVFMLCPFTETFNVIFADHVKPIVESISGLTCIRADNIFGVKPIMEDIWKSINEASIIISDLTDRNPNVFYETGIAHTVGKDVILVTQTIEDVPFDLRHLRCIVYNYDPRGMKAFEHNLEQTIKELLRNRK